MKPHDNYIMHFNKNHDPRNGQFTKGSGGSSNSNGSIKTNKKKMNPTLKKVLIGAGIAAGAVAIMATGNYFLHQWAEGIQRDSDKARLIRRKLMKEGRKATPDELKSIGNKLIRDNLAINDFSDFRISKEKSNKDFYNTVVKLDNQSKDSKSQLKQLSKDFNDYFKRKNGYNDPMIKGNWKKK